MVAETFVQCFTDLAEAPSGVKRLREMILQFAVMGKLVSQIPAEGTGAELVERIQGEIREQVESGAIRPRKPVPCVSLNDVPFEIPRNWAWARLQCLGEVNPRNDFADESEASFIPMALISEKYGDPPRSEKRIWKEIKKGFTHFADGDVVMAKITPCFQNRKSTVMRCLCNGTGAGTTELHVFRPVPETMVPDYVAIFLKSPGFIDQGVRRMTGSAGQKRVPHEYFASSLLPVPPRAEQERIVEKVAEIMALFDYLECRQQQREEMRIRLNDAAFDRLVTASDPTEFAAGWQRVRDNFDLLYAVPENVAKLRQAILQLAVQGKLVPQDPNDKPADALIEMAQAQKAARGQLAKPVNSVIDPSALPFLLPPGWELARMEDLFEVTGGIQKQPIRKPVKNHFPYLRVANVQRGKLDLSEIKRFELFEGELERWRLEPSDLLIVEGNGSEEEIGRCAEWRGEIADCVHQNHIIRCRPIDPRLGDFTLRFLNSPAGVAEMKRLAITTSGLYSLSVGKVRGIVIPVPPLAEQQRLVNRVGELMALCDDLEAKLKEQRGHADRLAQAVVKAIMIANKTLEE